MRDRTLANAWSKQNAMPVRMDATAAKLSGMSSPLPCLQLRVQLGGLERRVRLAAGAYVLGSGADADIRLQDPTISRRHLRIEIGSDRLMLTDLESRNGSWHEGRRIGELRHQLGIELTVRVGEVEIRLEPLDLADARLAIDGDEASSTALASLSGARVTLGEGSLGRFARIALPALLQELQGGAAPEAFAQSTVLQLHRQFDALWLRVRFDDAIVASAGSADGGQTRSWAAGRWSLLVDGAEELIQTNLTVFDLTLRLLGLSAPDAPDSADEPATRPAAGPPAPGSSNARLCTLYRESAQLAQSELAVLILGETGTGKELFARHLHCSAGLADDRWVALNCAALPDDQLEAELFGIDRGVATGVGERVGCFEQADGGTLFLDEIGDMSLATQAKILRVLQERQVFRVGSRRARPARVRLVSATNASLEAMMEAGQFRLDLYHRLADWVVTLPSLRERREDVANLAAHFLGREMRRLGKRFGGLSDASVALLGGYRWPGNVRELEREMLRCALILGDGEPLSADRLQPRFATQSVGASAGTLRQLLDDAERKAIANALADALGNVELAAERLDCGKSTLYRRIKQLGIDA